MAEFAAAVVELLNLAFQSSKIISEFAQKIKGQNARYTELADKIEKLSRVVENATNVINRLTPLNDPSLNVTLDLLKWAITKCQQRMEHVTEYVGRLNETLQKSMLDKFLHECRHEFSGKFSLKKALQDIEERERDISRAIASAQLFLTLRFGQHHHQVDPPPYPRAPSNGSFDVPSKESGSSLRSGTTGNTPLDNEVLAPQKGAPVKPQLSDRLVRAIKVKAKDDVREMIRLDTQILLEDHEGYCALHHAIQAGDNNVLRELLKSKELQDTPKGIDTGDRQGATALHHAAKAGKVKLAKKLIEAHATINITNNHDRSVLYMALKENEDEMVEFLLEKGAEDRNLPAELVKRLEEIKATIKWHQVTKEKAARKMRGNSLKVSVGG